MMRLNQKQKFRHDPDNGIYGDCSRTALAMLLGLERDSVPHFYDPACKAQEADRRRTEFLASRGLASVSFALRAAEVKDALRFMKVYNPGAPYILVGTSRNNCLHEVVCFEDSIVADPALDDSGITGPDEFGNFWVTVVVDRHSRGG